MSKRRLAIRSCSVAACLAILAGTGAGQASGAAGARLGDPAAAPSSAKVTRFDGANTSQASGGIVRANPGSGDTLVAPVIRGVQIYQCTAKPDGTNGYTQFNVKAKLKYGIDHTFVEDTAGPPQWVARDGSAVTAKKVSETPNGEGNIPELELAPTQSGKPNGLLAGTTKILRLNTKGGVAPAGDCYPDDVKEVPYQADYHFIK
jgi:Protein of unknown function (DUF3455)